LLKLPWGGRVKTTNGETKVCKARAKFISKVKEKNYKRRKKKTRYGSRKNKV